MSSDTKPLLVIITGISGAGNSTALKALEDLGLYCIDNLPPELIEQTADLYLKDEQLSKTGIAIGMDIRNETFAQSLPDIRAKLEKKLRLDLVFLTAENNVLATRYNATRRKHPLLMEGGSIIESIESEKLRLKRVRKESDIVFDTSCWNPHQLAREIEDRYSKDFAPRVLNISITSFGFKYGQIQPADSVFDVRFLRNPFFIDHLMSKSGIQQEVADYVFSRPSITGIF